MYVELCPSVKLVEKAIWSVHNDKLYYLRFVGDRLIVTSRSGVLVLKWPYGTLIVSVRRDSARAATIFGDRLLISDSTKMLHLYDLSGRRLSSKVFEGVITEFIEYDGALYVNPSYYIERIELEGDNIRVTKVVTAHDGRKKGGVLSLFAHKDLLFAGLVDGILKVYELPELKEVEEIRIDEDLSIEAIGKLEKYIVLIAATQRESTVRYSRIIFINESFDIEREFVLEGLKLRNFASINDIGFSISTLQEVAGYPLVAFNTTSYAKHPVNYLNVTGRYKPPMVSRDNYLLIGDSSGRIHVYKTLITSDKIEVEPVEVNDPNEALELARQVLSRFKEDPKRALKHIPKGLEGFIFENLERQGLIKRSGEGYKLTSCKPLSLELQSFDDEALSKLLELLRDKVESEEDLEIMLASIRRILQRERFFS